MLVERAARAHQAGVAEVWIDPGHRLRQDARPQSGPAGLVGRSGGHRLSGHGGDEPQELPGLVGVVRGGSSVPVDERLPGSLATATWAMAQGAGMVRVHDVAATVQAAVLVGGWASRVRTRVTRPAGRHGENGAAGGGNVKGKWAAGIPPRNFTWVIKDRLAMSERPGGFAPNHRKVRRQEEIIWLQVQGFTRVVSLLPSSHNLQAYEERSMASVHFPLPSSGDARGRARGRLPRAARAAHRRGADPPPPGGARRPGRGGGGRLPAVVRPAARAARRPSPCSST